MRVSVGEVTAPSQKSLTAIVLAGGSSRRLGGVDKTAIAVNGRTFLDRVLEFWPAGTELIVVGPPRPTLQAVTWCREAPPGGGPVSAIAAALPHVSTDLVALVGADMPLLGPAVESLLDAAKGAIGFGADGAWLVSSTGRQQPLASCMRKASLAAALPDEVDGQALFPLLQGLVLSEVPARDDWLLDADTDDDLEDVKNLLDRLEGSKHD
jgi:molybdopterin-guanine dinucleotide biosynthesis protein A